MLGQWAEGRAEEEEEEEEEEEGKFNSSPASSSPCQRRRTNTDSSFPRVKQTRNPRCEKPKTPRKLQSCRVWIGSGGEFCNQRNLIKLFGIPT